MGLLSLALLIDLIVGDPDWLWRRVPHPVVWIGKIIDKAEKLRESPKVRHWLRNEEIRTEDNTDFRIGIALMLILFVSSLLVGGLIDGFGQLGKLIEFLLVVTLIAQKSLYDHVLRVVDALRDGGVEAGRKSVSMIVGRDVSKLDESSVCKAAIESLAENFSDGVVAPVFWYAVFGLPGILFYKAVNTADSMIGHRNERYEHFGKAAAKVDDWMNWPAARLTSLLIAIAALPGMGVNKAKQIWEVTLRDSGLHRSPNAGWPESSFAAALGLALGGPRNYGSEQVGAAFLNREGRKHAEPEDVQAGLRLYLRACFLLIGLCGLCWLVFG